MNCIISEFPHAHAFIDDSLVVTKGTEIYHIGTVEKILKKVDEENMSLKLKKYKFAQRECEWLGKKKTHGSNTGTHRVVETAPYIISMEIVYGSIHSPNKYLPALAGSSAPLRPLLSKNNNYIWTTECCYALS